MTQTTRESGHLIIKIHPHLFLALSPQDAARTHAAMRCATSPQPSIFPSGFRLHDHTHAALRATRGPAYMRSVAPWQVALLVGCKHVACTLTTSSFSSLVPILQQPARDTEAVLSHAQHKHAASPPHLAHTPLGVCCVARAAASYFLDKVRSAISPAAAAAQLITFWPCADLRCHVRHA